MNETDNPTQPTQPPTEPSGWGSADGGTPPKDTAREMLGQLQSIIDNLATQAAPVVREIGAKAAEIAAIAAEKAGPIAQKTADVTQEAGTKLAERAREIAVELRRDASEPEGSVGTATAPRPMGSPADDPAEGRPDVGP
jgi:hypothetical protein